MTHIIYKEILNFTESEYLELSLPFNSQLLSVQVQREKICLWYRWNLEAKNDEPETRALLMVGTGHEVNNKYNLNTFLGTVQLMGGSFVFHIFEVGVLDK